MKRSEKILEDYLWQTYRIRDSEILNSIKRVLSVREQVSVKLHASVVTQKKLVVICEHPERLEEVILIGQQNPRKIHRRRLTLKRKKNTPEA